MPPRYWMVTNRNVSATGLGTDVKTPTYWVADEGPTDDFSKWTKVTYANFKTLLLAQIEQTFPRLTDPADSQHQKHVCFFVHGYNNPWDAACQRYESICKNLFSGNESLGICILYSWPSDGMVTNYLPDRRDAEASAGGLADLLKDVYEHLIKNQDTAIDDPSKACRAQLSIIAHSMGNYVLQNAFRYLWKNVNQPTRVSLMNQILLVAADVDNNLFRDELGDQSDGAAIANLSYRVSALYSRQDAVLGTSAGIKHFGERRLGRTGLDRTIPIKMRFSDVVWDIECSKLFKGNTSSIEAHSAYFESPKTIQLMRDILIGLDREIITTKYGG